MVATYYTHSDGLTSSGQKYNSRAMTCASRVFRLGTRLELISRSGRRAIVIVNDRTARGRTNVDCTPAAMRKLAGPDYREIGVLRHVHVHILGGQR